MKNYLPKVNIFDTPFIIDTERKEFRQADDPGNRIPFKDTHDNGDHIAILYDRRSKNVFKGNLAEVNLFDDVHLVTLPPLIAIDPSVGQRTGRKELYHFAQWMDADDVKKGSPLLMPTVKIDGTLFFVDRRLEELRQEKALHNTIPFSELLTVRGDMLEFLYDPKTKNAFRGTAEELRSRDDIKHVILPPMVVTDPLTFRNSVTKNAREKDKQQSEKQSPSIWKRFKRKIKP